MKIKFKNVILRGGSPFYSEVFVLAYEFVMDYPAYPRTKDNGIRLIRKKKNV